MKTLILTLCLLLATATAAWAACRTHTIFVGGRMVLCTTCCMGIHCTTTCQ